MTRDSTITVVRSATGGPESGEPFAVRVSGRASGSQRQMVQPFYTTDGRDRILSLFIEFGQFPEDRRLAGRIAELDEMLGGIVETSFGLYRAAAVEEGLSQLTIGAGQAFFVADHPVGVQRLREQPDGLIPLVLPGLFHGQVVVEDAEGAMVVERFEKIEGFQIVRTGLFGPVGADVQVAEIDESMGDGVGILLATLDRQHFFVAGVGLLQFAGQGIGVAEVAEAVREFTLGPGQAVVLTAASQATRAWTRSPRWRKMRARCLSFSAMS